MARDEIVSTKRNGRLPRGARVHAKGEKCEEACDLTKAKKTRVEKKKRKQSKVCVIIKNREGALLAESGLLCKPTSLCGF